MKSLKPIGGFFPLAQNTAQGEGISSLWELHEGNYVAFHNARSGLHYLLKLLVKKPQEEPRLWLPSYICTDAADAVKGTIWGLDFYPVDSKLAPDAEFLQQVLQEGDAVLGVDYFGRLPEAAFLTLVHARRDVTWIEDRAQALAPGKTWGDYALYSPRKLLGVADGGIVTGEHLGAPAYAYDEDTQFIEAARLRFEDKDEQRNAVWYPLYVEAEQRMIVSDRAMSEITAQILSRIDAEKIAEKRQTNFRYLHGHLHEWALWPEVKPWQDAAEEAWVPLGYVVKLEEERRDKVAQALYAEKIFAAVHWKELPSPKEGFKEAWKLSRELLTLPCDQRYDEVDMARVVEVFLKAING